MAHIPKLLIVAPTTTLMQVQELKHHKSS